MVFEQKVFNLVFDLKKAAIIINSVVTLVSIMGIGVAASELPLLLALGKIIGSMVKCKMCKCQKVKINKL